METWLLEIWYRLPDGASFLAAAALVAYLEGVVGIGLLMPGSTLVVLSGFLAFHGKADIVLLMFWTGLAALLGDLTSYWLGARFGHHLWNRGFLVRRRDLVRKAEIFFIENGAKSIFLGRFLGPIRGVVPFVAGSSRMSIRSFLAYALLSAMLWGLTFPGMGYIGGTGWQRAQSWAGRIGILVVLALAVAFIIALMRRHFLGPTKKTGTGDAGRGTRKSKPEVKN